MSSAEAAARTWEKGGGTPPGRGMADEPRAAAVRLGGACHVQVVDTITEHLCKLSRLTTVSPP